MLRPTLTAESDHIPLLDGPAVGSEASAPAQTRQGLPAEKVQELSQAFAAEPWFAVTKPTENQSPYIRTLREQHPRAYEPMTNGEIAALTEFATAGGTVEQASQAFGRQPSSITANYWRNAPEAAQALNLPAPAPEDTKPKAADRHPQSITVDGVTLEGSSLKGEAWFAPIRDVTTMSATQAAIRAQYPRAFEVWTAEETKALQEHFTAFDKEGTLESAVREFARQPNSIVAAVWKHSPELATALKFEPLAQSDYAPAPRAERQWVAPGHAAGFSLRAHLPYILGAAPTEKYPTPFLGLLDKVQPVMDRAGNALLGLTLTMTKERQDAAGTYPPGSYYVGKLSRASDGTVALEGPMTEIKSGLVIDEAAGTASIKSKGIYDKLIQAGAQVKYSLAESAPKVDGTGKTRTYLYPHVVISFPQDAAGKVIHVLENHKNAVEALGGHDHKSPVMAKAIGRLVNTLREGEYQRTDSSLAGSLAGAKAWAPKAPKSAAVDADASELRVSRPAPAAPLYEEAPF